MPPSRPNDRCRGAEAAASAPRRPSATTSQAGPRSSGSAFAGNPTLRRDDPYVRSMRRDCAWEKTRGESASVGGQALFPAGQIPPMGRGVCGEVSYRKLSFREYIFSAGRSIEVACPARRKLFEGRWWRLAHPCFTPGTPGGDALVKLLLPPAPPGLVLAGWFIGSTGGKFEGLSNRGRNFRPASGAYLHARLARPRVGVAPTTRADPDHLPRVEIRVAHAAANRGLPRPTHFCSSVDRRSFVR